MSPTLNQNTAGTAAGLSGNPTIGITSLTASGRIVGAAVDNVIPFLYSNLSDLPSASSYHGAFAHVHNEGAAYFAHGGNWENSQIIILVQTIYPLVAQLMLVEIFRLLAL